ncbi:MAG: tetratricopeptide repeat protein [Candidatus Moduliflexus flocculans]|nr:tetratricopeptide repeat protein [Candidatus Moduliflexus flocculans]
MARRLEQALLALASRPGRRRSGGRRRRRAAVREAPARARLRQLRPGRQRPARCPIPRTGSACSGRSRRPSASRPRRSSPRPKQAYREVVRDIPDSPESYVNLALVEARQGAFDRALATLREGLARIPDSDVLLVRLGHTYLVSGKPREALETMEKVLVLYPESLDALTVVAGILDATGRKPEARTYYERALAVEPESRHLRMSLAGQPGHDRLARGGRRRLRGAHRGTSRTSRPSISTPASPPSLRGRLRPGRLVPAPGRRDRPDPDGGLQPGRGLPEERGHGQRGGGLPFVPADVPQGRRPQLGPGPGRARAPRKDARRRAALTALSPPRSAAGPRAIASRCGAMSVGETAAAAVPARSHDI